LSRQSEIELFEATSDRLRVLALEPHLSLSHRVFLEGYQRYSRHEITVWSLPARAWKWRMRASAYHYAERARALPANSRPHCVLASDYLNVAEWQAFTRPLLDRTPVVLYFHENQATYPLADHAPTDTHFGWINLSSARAADAVLFNSNHHREDFLAAVRAAVRSMPMPVPERLIDELEEGSRVFPVGIDFAPHDRVRQQAGADGDRTSRAPPTILWNHRWEFDKAPEQFVDALIRLKQRGRRFRLILCGGRGAEVHPAATRARQELREEIVLDRFFEDQDDYLKALAQADIVASTARHEFFGVSVAEAIYMGCLPILPWALSYPELLPPGLHNTFLYDPTSPFDQALEGFLATIPTGHEEELHAFISRYDWRRLAPQLDALLLETVVRGNPNAGC
jgi:glycosyltransferase involved in cell wall biosynthesis